MNRRRFLVTGSALAAATLLPGCTNNRQDNTLHTDNLSAANSNESAMLDASSNLRAMKVGVPKEGRYYHGVYPGRPVRVGTGKEDDIEFSDLKSYESAEAGEKGVGREAAWVYFSNNWDQKQEFPGDTVKWIRAQGRVPFIRLMLRTSFEHNKLEIDYKSEPCKIKKEPQNLETKYTLDFILKDEKTRDDLRRWGEKAGKVEGPLIVEWGTEMNGFWFAWNGWWNGKSEGPDKFKEAYRHIVRQVREGGADNITWVFHVNGMDDPNPLDECEAQLGVDWNRFERYYPDDIIDWLGVSVYGALKPADEECQPFKPRMDQAYKRLKAMTKDQFKPIFVLEFGATMNNKHCGEQPGDSMCKKLGGAARWADHALESILNNPEWRERLRGFSWWNEWWDNDDNPKNDTNMRVQDVPCLKEVFRKHLVTNDPKREKIVERPLS